MSLIMQLTSTEEELNRVQDYRFTFGCGQPHEGHFVKIRGTYDFARRRMFEKFGDKWCFQYSEKEWEENIRRSQELGYPLETEIK